LKAEAYFKKFAWQFKPKHLQQSLVTVIILDVLNNFISKRVTAKSSECRTAFQNVDHYIRSGYRAEVGWGANRGDY